MYVNEKYFSSCILQLTTLVIPFTAHFTVPIEDQLVRNRAATKVHKGRFCIPLIKIYDITGLLPKTDSLENQVKCD